MINRTRPVIDMTPDGRFIDRPMPSLGQIAGRLAAFGIGLAVIGVLFWAAIFLLPVLLVLGVAGYALLRGQMRRGSPVVYQRTWRI